METGRNVLSLQVIHAFSGFDGFVADFEGINSAGSAFEGEQRAAAVFEREGLHVCGGDAVGVHAQ